MPAYQIGNLRCEVTSMKYYFLEAYYVIFLLLLLCEKSSKVIFLGKLFLVSKFQNTVSAERNIDGSQTSNFDSEREEVNFHI